MSLAGDRQTAPRSLSAQGPARYCRDVRRDVPDISHLPPRLRQLIADGRAVAPTRDHREVLREIGVPPGPVTDAGTRALQEQRGERG